MGTAMEAKVARPAGAPEAMAGAPGELPMDVVRHGTCLEVACSETDFVNVGSRGDDRVRRMLAGVERPGGREGYQSGQARAIPGSRTRPRGQWTQLGAAVSEVC